MSSKAEFLPHGRRKQELEKPAVVLILRYGQLPEPVQLHISEDTPKHPPPPPGKEGTSVPWKTRKVPKALTPQRACESLSALEEAASTLSSHTGRLERWPVSWAFPPNPRIHGTTSQQRGDTLIYGL